MNAPAETAGVGSSTARHGSTPAASPDIDAAESGGARTAPSAVVLGRSTA